MTAELARLIAATYDPYEQGVMAYLADAYLAWLDTLPTL